MLSFKDLVKQTNKKHTVKQGKIIQYGDQKLERKKERDRKGERARQSNIERE